MVYKFAKTARMPGDPQAVGEALQAIRDEKGSLTAPLVVEAATPEDNLLHRYFEWDDQKAATRWRLEQAGQIIRSVVVATTPNGEDLAQPVRAFCHVVIEEDSSYESVQAVMIDPDLRLQVLDEVAKDLATTRRKLESLKEFSDLLQGVDELQQRVIEKKVHI